MLAGIVCTEEGKGREGGGGERHNRDTLKRGRH